MPSNPREIAKKVYDTFNDESQPVTVTGPAAAKILEGVPEAQLPAVRCWMEEDYQAGFLIDFLMGR